MGTHHPKREREKHHPKRKRGMFSGKCTLADMQQCIPSMVDGLNQVQRTILCCSFKHDFITEIWMNNFLGYVLLHSAFHYDAKTLTEAIIGMSHDFIGTNNVNLFNPRGLFRTRLEGGKGHAPAVCFSTNLTPIARLMFPKDDDILLNYLNEDDGQRPTWYAPVIPFVLVNGCQEFGIGWSTFVPNYNPKDVCANVRHLLNGEPMVPIDPWYKGFQGTIERNGATSYTTSGKIEYIDDTTLRITELPVHTWTECYTEFLDTLCAGTGEIEEPFIKNYRVHNNDDTTDHFEINMSKQNMNLAKKEGLVNKFKLTTTISTNNMHLCDPQGVIKKYDNPEQILKEFFDLRLQLYRERKKMLLAYLQLELFKIEYKEKFILGVENGRLIVWTRAEIFRDLKQKGLLILFQKTKKFDNEKSSQATGDLEVNEEQVSSFYEDLLSSMGIRTLTSKRELELQKNNLTIQINELKDSTPEKLWMKDIDALDQKLDELNMDAIAEADVDRENEAGMAVEEATHIHSPHTFH